jgi:heme/copper-type cytochrome/quinol oxidase subunit 2
LSAIRRITIGAAAILAALLLAGMASACPTCKDNLASDPASASLVRGYAYSILFMLSMPPLIFGGLSAYFYWEVRRARARQARAHAADVPSIAPHSA